MKKNKVKEKLQAGKVSVGLWSGIASPDVAEALANIGFDWIVFDMEHAPLTIDKVQTLIMATSGTETVPMVRVANNDPVLIKGVLDIGAYGLVIPLVNSRDEAIRAVSACKYPTKGIRGAGPRRASTYFLDVEDYLKRANDEIMVIPQIEHIDAVNNINEILSVDGIDAFFVGPWDLSTSMGYLAELPKIHPEVVAAINRTLEAGKRHGVPAGIWGGNLENVRKYAAQGFQFIVLAQDLDYILKAKEDCEKIREIVK